MFLKSFFLLSDISKLLVGHVLFSFFVLQYVVVSLTLHFHDDKNSREEKIIIDQFWDGILPVVIFKKNFYR